MTESKNDSEAFEILVRDLLEARMSLDLPNAKFEIKHNQSLVGKSRHEHQIDVVAELKLADLRLLVLVECERYRRRVGIDDVMQFASRIDDISAHKGILDTTVGFERGAIKFAKSKGIALVIAADCYWITKEACETRQGRAARAKLRQHRLEERRQEIPKMLQQLFGDAKLPERLCESIADEEMAIRNHHDGVAQFGHRQRDSWTKPVFVVCLEEPNYERLVFSDDSSALPDGVFDIQWLFSTTDKGDFHRRHELFQTRGFFPERDSVLLDPSHLFTIAMFGTNELQECHLTSEALTSRGTSRCSRPWFKKPG